MNILVVDDSKKHRKSAESLRTHHTLTLLDSYEPAIKLLRPGTDIDVLLSDLLMPAETYALGQKGLQYLGHEIDIGLFLLLRASLAGVRYAAVITDTGHHDHPISAAVDWIEGLASNGKPTTFKIANTTALVAHAPLNPDGSKDWQKVLETLTAAD